MFMRVFMATILNILSVFLFSFCHRPNNCATGVRSESGWKGVVSRCGLRFGFDVD